MFVCIFSVLSLVSSVFTLSLIACDRFFGIVFAMKAHLTERKAHTFIILIWICSIGISVPLLFYRKQESRVWLNHVEVWWVLIDPSIWIKVSFCAISRLLSSSFLNFVYINWIRDLTQLFGAIAMLDNFLQAWRATIIYFGYPCFLILSGASH